MNRSFLAAAVGAAAILTYATSAQATTLDGVAAGVPRFVHAATFAGPVSPTHQMHLVVHLAYPNPGAVDQFLGVVNDPRSPEFGHFLTPAQFDAAFAPSVTTYASVVGSLRTAGFEIYRTYPNRKVVDIVGSAAAVERFFSTLVEAYTIGGRTFFANTVPALIPNALRRSVSAVSGFNDHDAQYPNLRLSRAPVALGTTRLVLRPSRLAKTARFVSQNSGLNPAPAGQFGPLEIETAYDYPEIAHPTINGNGKNGHATIAIETAFDYSDSDLQDYWTTFNVQRTATPTQGQPYVEREIVDCPQCAGNGVPAPYENVETTADVEQSSSNAPGANILIYEGTNNLNTTFDDVYEETVQDPRVDVVTTSWGGCESDDDSNEVFADNDLFKQGAAEGQTMFAASGDNGSSGNCSSVSNGPIFPASSPYVAGAGGTDLTVNTNDTWASETGDASSGGGVSVLFALPQYQAGIPGLVSSTGRNVPDVALDYLDYTICYGDQIGTGMCPISKALVVNGTSLVAPNMAAAYGAFDAYYGRRLGLAQTGLYNGFARRTYPMSPACHCLAWHDITSGSNGIYTATAGYDAVTGTGSLDMYCYMLQIPHPGKTAL